MDELRIPPALPASRRRPQNQREAAAKLVRIWRDHKRTSLLIALALLLGGCAFASWSGSSAHPPGLFMGLWHGLLAPWTLILRWFMDIRMYAVPNSGWFYDLGFLIGVALSIPIGWIGAILAVMHVWLVAQSTA